MHQTPRKTALEGLHSLKIDLPESGGASLLGIRGESIPPPTPSDGRDLKRWSKPDRHKSETEKDRLLADHLAKQRRLAHFALMIGVRDLLFLKASRDGKDWPEEPANCLRLKVPNRTPMIMHSAADRRARYKNMRRCRSVWACPTCGAAIGDERRIELVRGLVAATERGWQIFMLTFTIQHKADQALREVLGILKSAYKDFRTGKQWTKITERYGLEGSVQGKETTHGKSGWHPHLHVLFFSSLAEFPADEAADFLKRRWMRMVSKHGGFCTYENGLILTISTDSTIAEKNAALAKYPEKMGLADIDIDASTNFTSKRSWSIASEIAKSATKQGKKGGVTPLQLLALAMTGDERSGDLWLEYFEAFKGQRQAYWSQGLREKLGLDAEKTDEEIAEAALHDELPLMLLTDEILDALKKNERGKNARGVLLEIASAGNPDLVWSFLQGIGVERPRDEITYRRTRIDLDTMTVTDLGEVSGNVARSLIEADSFRNVLVGGDQDDKKK